MLEVLQRVFHETSPMNLGAQDHYHQLRLFRMDPSQLNHQYMYLSYYPNHHHQFHLNLLDLNTNSNLNLQLFVHHHQHLPLNFAINYSLNLGVDNKLLNLLRLILHLYYQEYHHYQYPKNPRQH